MTAQELLKPAFDLFAANFLGWKKLHASGTKTPLFGSQSHIKQFPKDASPLKRLYAIVWDHEKFQKLSHAEKISFVQLLPTLFPKKAAIHNHLGPWLDTILSSRAGPDKATRQKLALAFTEASVDLGRPEFINTVLSQDNWAYPAPFLGLLESRPDLMLEIVGASKNPNYLNFTLLKKSLESLGLSSAIDTLASKNPLLIKAWVSWLLFSRQRTFSPARQADKDTLALLWPSFEKVIKQNPKDHLTGLTDGLTRETSVYGNTTTPMTLPWSASMKLWLLKETANSPALTPLCMQLLTRAESLTPAETLTLVEHPFFAKKISKSHGHSYSYQSKAASHEAALSALLAHPSTDYSTAKAIITKWIKLHPKYLAETAYTNHGSHDLGGAWGFLSLWPELYQDKDLGSHFSHLVGSNKDQDWYVQNSLLQSMDKGVMERPAAAKALTKLLLTPPVDPSHGLSSLLKFLDTRQDLLPNIPWTFVLKKAQGIKLRSPVRFKLQAIAARSNAVLPPGVNPISGLEERIGRIKSGHTAAQMLIELAKDNGSVLRMLPGIWILRLLRIGALSAESWQDKTWAALINLKDIALPGEQAPELLQDGMKTFLRPHLKATAVDPGVLGWLLPPLTSSQELPAIFGQIPPSARIELAKQLIAHPYSSASPTRSEEALVEAFEKINIPIAKPQAMGSADSDTAPSVVKKSRAVHKVRAV